MLLIHLIAASCPWGGNVLKYLAPMRWQMKEPGLGTIICWPMCLSSCCRFLHQPCSSLFKIPALCSFPSLVYLTDLQSPVLGVLWHHYEFWKIWLCLKRYLDYLKIVWLQLCGCVTSVNVVWGFEGKYIWRSEEEVYENPQLGFKQWWLRIVYAGVSCAAR